MRFQGFNGAVEAARARSKEDNRRQGGAAPIQRPSHLIRRARWEWRVRFGDEGSLSPGRTRTPEVDDGFSTKQPSEAVE